jgi:hypothetical protein
MVQRNYAVILAFLWIVLSISGCGGGDANSAANQRPGSQASSANKQPRTNAEELGLIAKMPYETLDIVWKEFPSAKRVLAVMRYSTADANKIVAEAGGNPEGQSIQVETWFPDELIAQSEMSGDSALKGIAYPATAFYQEPYTEGKITRIEGTDFFVLDLKAK